MAGLRGGGAFTAVPTPSGVGVAAVRAPGRSGGAAIKDRSEIASFRAGAIGASLLSFCIVERAEGACRRFLFAAMFDVAELPALLALGLG